jgi:hypothetical protein
VCGRRIVVVYVASKEEKSGIYQLALPGWLQNEPVMLGQIEDCLAGEERGEEKEVMHHISLSVGVGVCQTSGSIPVV